MESQIITTIVAGVGVLAVAGIFKVVTQMTAITAIVQSVKEELQDQRRDIRIAAEKTERILVRVTKLEATRLHNQQLGHIEDGLEDDR
jgi:hypothetical protein